MALTQLNQLAIAFKKLSGKTHTNSNFGANNESIGSSVQLGTSTIFGETIASSPNTALFSTSSGVEKIAFELSPIDLSIYTVKTGSLAANTSSSIGNQGDGAPTLGVFSNGYHAYALKITGSYQANSNNPKKGTAPFIDGYHVSGSGGTLQLVPEQYGPSYIATIKSQSTTIFPGNEIDYYLDYYSGILFVQDYASTVVPTTVESYIYIGKYAKEVISSGSGEPAFPFSGSAVITGSLTISGSGITVNGGNITLTSSSITSESSSISFTTGSITITSGSITVNTGSFVGDLIGTSSWASKVVVTELNTNGPFPIVFTSNNQLYQKPGQLTYNPSTNTLSLGSGIVAAASFTGSLFGTASWANNVITASHALTASSVNTLNQNVTINGTLTAYTGSFNVLTVNYISASVIYSSGSNVFGDELTDTQTFTGSVYITGSNFTWNGNTVITTADTASMTVSSASYASSSTSASYAQTASFLSVGTYNITASWAQSASNAVNAQTASFLPVNTYNITASWASSASNAVNAQTASFLPVATYNITSSWAQSASNAVNSQTASFLPIGTYNITASWAQSASNAVNSQTASFLPIGTYNITASWATNALTASFLPVATYNITASWAQSASNAVNSQTASFLPVATYNITSSWAQSSSNAVNAQTASFLPVGTYNITASWAQSASNAVNAQTASFLPVNTYNITASWAQSASNAVNSQTASFLPVATYNITASWAQSASNAVNAQTASYVNTLNQDVTINGTTSTTNLTVTSNATITGNLTVNGTTTYVNVNDLLVKDKFILLNSGSLTDTPNEGGIIVQTTSSEGVAYGTALYYDQQANRWVVNRSGSVAWNATSSVLSTQSDFIVTVTGSAGAPTGTPINFGSGDYFYGQMYINTSNSDIYIYA